MGMEKTADVPLALPAGTVLAGKYVILQALGQGGGIQDKRKNCNQRVFPGYDGHPGQK